MILTQVMKVPAPHMVCVCVCVCEVWIVQYISELEW